MPPCLAGRQAEETEFRRLLGQDAIVENLVLTGLRGVGKTVLLETLKPIAMQESWLWIGADLSESTSVSENSLATRVLTDLSVITSTIAVGPDEHRKSGARTLSYAALHEIYEGTPGLASDKLKAVFEVVWRSLPKDARRGVIFAYDEAQNLSDNAAKEEYPLSLLLDVFQSIQRKGIRFMLVLTGLPTLYPKLVETRTYTERMFHVVFLDRLGEDDCREAILKPIDDSDCPVRFADEAVEVIREISGGYPYFIQFICREVFDAWLQNPGAAKIPSVPVTEIISKLDSDFFSGRWARATDRQRDLLTIVASLDKQGEEFTVREIVNRSAALLDKGFSASQANQMLAALGRMGLVYKNRHGRYAFAVPLLDDFVRRQVAREK
jgi:type II secretory pathway predicted ATPase ExeA